MARTDKDIPFKFREADYMNCCCFENGSPCRECAVFRNFGPESSSFRKGKKTIKREGNKRFRRDFKQPRRYRGRCPFYSYKTVRTNAYFY